MIVVAAVTVVVQWPVQQAGAICFDDSEYLVQNPLVQHPGAANAWRFLREVLEPSSVHGYYQPLTMISLMLDYAAGGRPEHLTPFHRTSLILHTLNAALVTLLLYELFGHIWAAGLIGLLFGVHPMTVETIAWVGERKTVLAAFFALLALLSYVHYARGRGRGWYALCAGLFVLALLAKPTATPLPLCLLLLDAWPLKRLSRKAVIEKVPLLVIAAVSAWITYESQKRTAVTVLPSREEWWHIPLLLGHNIVFYLQRMVWPVHSSAHYMMPLRIAPSDGRFAIGLAGTIVIVAALLASLRWTRAAAVGWLYFFVAIFPTMNVIGFTNVIAADNFAYLPAVGLMLPLTGLIAWWWDQARWPWSAVRRGMIVAGAAGALAGLSICTRAYIDQWADSERLFQYMLRLSPDSPTLHLFLGKKLADKGGRYREAIEHYRQTVQAAPDFEMGQMELGFALAKVGQLDEAIQHYRTAIKIKPDYYEAQNNLGNALTQKGEVAEAIQHYRKAVGIRPGAADARYNLANALIAVGQTAEALEQYQAALANDPAHAQAHKNFATALLQLNRRAEAASHYREALRLWPGWWDVANQLAWMYADPQDRALYNLNEALRFAEIACRITGRREPTPLATLAIMQARAGRLAEARRTADEALAAARSRGNQTVLNEIEQRLQRELAGSRPADRP